MKPGASSETHGKPVGLNFRVNPGSHLPIYPSRGSSTDETRYSFVSNELFQIGYLVTFSGIRFLCFVENIWCMFRAVYGFILSYLNVYFIGCKIFSKNERRNDAEKEKAGIRNHRPLQG